MSHRIGTYPLELDLSYGELKLGTITIDVPVNAGPVETNDDGSRYVTVTPGFTDGWLERALTEAVATVDYDTAADATVRSMTGADR